MLDVAGVEIPARMQGLSIKPLLKGSSPKDWRSAVYYRYYESKAHAVAKHEGVYDGRYKLINFYELGYWELFDLQRDPYELRSCYENPEYKDVVARMKEELARLKREYEVG